MADICGDNRFELIEKYKQKLLDATNIEDSPEEMAVIDNILFRFWQMGWLKGELFGNSEQLESDHVADPGKMVGDLISRSAVLDEIHKYMEERDYTIGTLYDNICEMPSVQSTMGQVNQGDTVNERAVKFLDLFAKTYCRDKSVTDELKFRCSECKFEMPDKTCLVKCMARKLCPDYKDFGSMGGYVMNDLISRAAVVDAIEGVDWYHINKNGEMVHGANDNYHQAWYKAEDIYKAVERVLSAQSPKEIPKRVLWSGWKGYRDTRYKCPNCEKPVRNDDTYCHRCGQRLMFPHISFTDYVPGEKQDVIVRWDDEG